MNSQSELTLEPPCFRWLTIAQWLLSLRLFCLGAMLWTFHVTYVVMARTQDSPALRGAVVPCWIALGITVALCWVTMHLTRRRSRDRSAVPSSQVFAEAQSHVLSGGTLVTRACLRHATVRPPRTRRLNAVLEISRRGIAVRKLGCKRSRGSSTPDPELWILWEAVHHIDWTLEDVQLDLMEGRVTIQCAKLPLIFGPLDHFPQLRRSVQGATFALMSFNQSLAALLQATQTELTSKPTHAHTNVARVANASPPSHDTIETRWVHDTIESQTVPCAMAPTPAPTVDEAPTEEFNYPDSALVP